jgi:hypothetical protein
MEIVVAYANSYASGARTASGHNTAAPPSSVMKSRRFIRSPRRYEI